MLLGNESSTTATFVDFERGVSTLQDGVTIGAMLMSNWENVTKEDVKKPLHWMRKLQMLSNKWDAQC